MIESQRIRVLMIEVLYSLSLSLLDCRCCQSDQQKSEFPLQNHSQSPQRRVRS